MIDDRENFIMNLLMDLLELNTTSVVFRMKPALYKDFQTNDKIAHSKSVDYRLLE